MWWREEEACSFLGSCLCLSTALAVPGWVCLASASRWKQRSARANCSCSSATAISQPVFPWKFFTRFDDAELSFKLVTNLESLYFPGAQNCMARISQRPADGMRSSPSGTAAVCAVLIFEDTLTRSFPNCALCSQVKQCVCLISSGALSSLSRFSWTAFIDTHFSAAQAAGAAVWRCDWPHPALFSTQSWQLSSDLQRG